ncbi:MAG: SGNH/GDSL hydrolase family protein [Anaerolineae bacterium]
MTTSSRTELYLFAGDSLTEGVYGEGYVERVAQALSQIHVGRKIEVVNVGRGGDTVRSLLHRIDEPLHRYRPRWVILAIGSNDVWWPWLSSHSLGWRLWFYYRQWALGQTPTTDLDQFAAAYRALIDKARTVARAQVVACTLSPLGEQLASPLNHQLARLNGVIKHIAADCRVLVADIWQAFVEELASLSGPSSYVPGEWLFAFMDRRRLQVISPDELSRRRHLHLTCDGIHLNSRGADLWAETIVATLLSNQGIELPPPPGLPPSLKLIWAGEGPLQIWCTPGWESRTRALAPLLIDTYHQLASLTGIQPPTCTVVLSSVHWPPRAGSSPYPMPTVQWDGTRGTVLIPATYSDSFLRDLCLPQLLATWTAWPRTLAGLEPARASALADLLIVRELARLFLQQLRISPTDPELTLLLATYLTQVVLRRRRGEGADEMTAAWEAWGEVLAQSGTAEGEIRRQAVVLYQIYGEELVASLVNRPSSVAEQVEGRLVPEASGSNL